jgi:nucleoside-diphosphate-sugar epimerase
VLALLRTALRVCETFLSSGQGRTYESSPRPFVYISAEDVFRPVIPLRYIETKREAEKGIEAMLNDQYRGVYIRPSMSSMPKMLQAGIDSFALGLVYHAHNRPLTTPAAALIDLSSSIHEKIPPGIPTPSQILRSLSTTFSPRTSTGETGSPLESIANCMTIPPIHVDHVAEAVCAALLNKDVRGALGVWRMRELIGWGNANQTENPMSSTSSYS